MEESILILLIEDDAIDAESVRRMLAGVPTLQNGEVIHFEVTRAETLQEGLAWLENRHFDLVLLDLALPDQDGLQTVEQLHSQHPQMGIVILTGLESEDLGLEGVRLGAEDYLLKGEITVSSLLRSLSFSYERTRRRRAEGLWQEANTEQIAAQAVHRRLLPQSAPKLEGLEIAGACHPATLTGGDYFDYFRLQTGELGLLVADVSGHGLAPSFVMAGARSALRSVLEFTSSLPQLMASVNRAVLEDTQSEYFITMFLVILDLDKRTFQYLGAGHNAFWFKADGQIVELEPACPPLGVLEKLDLCPNPPQQLATGDTLLLMTDGFQEAQQAEGEMLGETACLQEVCDYQEEPAQTIVNQLFSISEEHCAPEKPFDDRTVVVLKVTD